MTWWLARSISGPIAGIVAALVMALSASAIDESTFIWNPNLIALSSAVTLAAAWRGRTTGHAALVAPVGVRRSWSRCNVTSWGSPCCPRSSAFWVATWRVTPAGPERRRLTWSGLGGVAIIALGYVPLLVSELGHDFAESRAALAFIASGGTGVTIALPIRLLFVGSADPRLAADGTAHERSRDRGGGRGHGRRGAGLAGRRRVAAANGPRRAGSLATLAFGWIVLTLGAAGLSTVTPLPVDHYHAFLDPVVFIALGMVVAAVWQGLQDGSARPRRNRRPRRPRQTRRRPTRPRRTRRHRPMTSTGSPAARPTPANVLRLALAGVVVGLGILIAWNISVWPPAVAADGGWPAARVAADRIEAAAGDRAIQLIGLPAFKSTEAYGFPLERDGRRVVESIPLVPVPGGPVPDPTAAAVVLCDTLFVEDCGGPAETAALAALWPGRARARGSLAARAGSDDLGLPAGTLTGRHATDDTDGQKRTPAPPVGRRSRSPRPGRGGRDPGRLEAVVSSGWSDAPTAVGSWSGRSRDGSAR